MERPAVRRPTLVDETALERQLLRRSVEGLALERHRCADCGRTPLVGEHIHLFAAGEIVCELCRCMRPVAPVSSERVRHSELGHAVRVTRSA